MTNAWRLCWLAAAWPSLRSVAFDHWGDAESEAGFADAAERPAPGPRRRRKCKLNDRTLPQTLHGTAIGLPRNGQGWCQGGQWGGIYAIHGVYGYKSV